MLVGSCSMSDKGSLRNFADFADFISNLLSIYDGRILCLNLSLK